MPVRLALATVFVMLITAMSAGAQDVAFLCQVRGLEPGGGDFLAVHACADTSCEKVGEFQMDGGGHAVPTPG